uniref:Prokineticin domain-containing protein n=1 Tax=Equus asinus TaxID=9793 RepID=A0A9L0JVY5_EQUAS
MTHSPRRPVRRGGGGGGCSQPSPAPRGILEGPSLWFLPGALPGSKAPLFLLQACERDVQCRPGTCCAVSLWLRGLRMCTPLGREGDDCHPGSHKIPFFRKRQHHTCPCLPNLLCARGPDGRVWPMYTGCRE